MVVVLPGGPILRRLGREMLEFGRTPRGLFTDLDDEPFFRRTKFTGVTLVGDNLVLVANGTSDLNLCSILCRVWIVYWQIDKQIRLRVRCN